jgi:alpha-tubulin suppressor-like RCC1 family protein
VQVAGGLTFTSLAANATSESTCGLTVGGEAWCWGRNGAGSLGNGMDNSAARVPAQVMTSLRFVSVSISESTACGVSTEGDAYCWGDNRYGQLGVGSAGIDGGLAGSNSPVAVQGGEKFIQVATDGLHSCALQQSGTLFCWGLRSWMSSVAFNSSRHDNVYDSLPTRAGGLDNSWYDGYPTPDSGTPWVGTTGSPWTGVAVGHGQTCALAANGALDCWGQLWGDPLSWGPYIAPYPVRMGGDRAFITFASGGGHDCAISADGCAYCWGSNNWGQTGRAPQLSW